MRGKALAPPRALPRPKGLHVWALIHPFLLFAKCTPGWSLIQVYETAQLPGPGRALLRQEASRAFAQSAAERAVRRGGTACLRGCEGTLIFDRSLEFTLENLSPGPAACPSAPAVLLSPCPPLATTVVGRDWVARLVCGRLHVWTGRWGAVCSSVGRMGGCMRLAAVAGRPSLHAAESGKASSFSIATGDQVIGFKDVLHTRAPRVVADDGCSRRLLRFYRHPFRYRPLPAPGTLGPSPAQLPPLPSSPHVLPSRS